MAQGGGGGGRGGGGEEKEKMEVSIVISYPTRGERGFCAFTYFYWRQLTLLAQIKPWYLICNNSRWFFDATTWIAVHKVNFVTWVKTIRWIDFSLQSLLLIFSLLFLIVEKISYKPSLLAPVQDYGGTGLWWLASILSGRVSSWYVRSLGLTVR